jgi:hypothetical protein
LRQLFLTLSQFLTFAQGVPTRKALRCVAGAQNKDFLRSRQEVLHRATSSLFSQAGDGRMEVVVIDYVVLWCQEILQPNSLGSGHQTPSFESILQKFNALA